MSTVAVPGNGRTPSSVGLDAVEADELVTGEAVALDARTASFFQRAASGAIDLVAYFGGTILLMLGVVAVADPLGVDEALAQALSIVVVVTGFVAAPIAVELLTRGKSAGRAALGIRIVRDDGGAIGFRHAFVRALTGVLEVMLTLGAVATLVAVLHPKAKRLGDVMAGTYAMRERLGPAPAEPRPMPDDLVEWAATADVARMPDPLARRIAQYLGQADRMEPQHRDRMAASLVGEATPYVHPWPHAHATTALVAIAAVRRDRERAALDAESARLERLDDVLRALPHRFPERG